MSFQLKSVTHMHPKCTNIQYMGGQCNISAYYLGGV